MPDSHRLTYTLLGEAGEERNLSWWIRLFDCQLPLQAQGVPALTVKHLAAAAAKARPSIPAPERERLEAIYSRFRGGRDPGFGGVSASAKGKGKLATLA